jgi:hypothetical protein
MINFKGHRFPAAIIIMAARWGIVNLIETRCSSTTKLNSAAQI